MLINLVRVLFVEWLGENINKRFRKEYGNKNWRQLSLDYFIEQFCYEWKKNWVVVGRKCGDFICFYLVSIQLIFDRIIGILGVKVVFCSFYILFVIYFKQ